MNCYTKKYIEQCSIYFLAFTGLIHKCDHSGWTRETLQQDTNETEASEVYALYESNKSNQQQ